MNVYEFTVWFVESKGQSKIMANNSLVHDILSFITSCQGIVKKKKSIQNLEPLSFIWKSLYYHLKNKNIFAHPHTDIIGLDGLVTNGTLLIGVNYEGFLGMKTITQIINFGKLIIYGNVKIGRGCRFEIGPNAVISLHDCFINSESDFFILHGLEIGEGTLVSWHCQFVDGDYHNIEYEGRKKKENPISIGKHVWIGNKVTIYKGVRIGDNSVIAANSVVVNSFPQTNVLIAGHPAKIIRENISWT